MLKKIIVLLMILGGLSLGLLMAASPGRAQMPGPPAGFFEVYKDMPPISQSDIDKYLQAAPKIFSLGFSPSPEQLARVYDEVGWDQTHYGYISLKLAIGQAMSLDMPLEQFGFTDLPSHMIPTPAEMELIKKNAAAFDEMLK